jgi:hypothetical protein
MADDVVLEVALGQLQPVFSHGSDGKVVFGGYQLVFEPVVVSSETLRSLRLEAPHRLRFVVSREE